MRVADSMFFDMNRSSVALNKLRHMETQERVITGKRVQKPSDDPLASTLARRERARHARADTHIRATESIIADLQNADSALSHVGDIMIRVRELAVLASNDTYSAENRRATAREVEKLREQVIALGNTRGENDRYLFAGYRDDTAPFDPAGTYVGDGAVREVEVAPGIRQQTGVSGGATFTPPAGVDILAVLDSLRVALDTNAVATIRTSLTDLTTATDQVVDARAELGALSLTTEVARSSAERVQMHTIEREDQLLGIDQAEAVSDMVQAEHALQIAISVASRLPPKGLIDRR